MTGRTCELTAELTESYELTVLVPHDDWPGGYDDAIGACRAALQKWVDRSNTDVDYYEVCRAEPEGKRVGLEWSVAVGSGDDEMPGRWSWSSRFQYWLASLMAVDLTRRSRALDAALAGDPTPVADVVDISHYR